MNQISLSRAVVHVPAQVTVYDTASPLYRFLHRQVSRVRAVLVQKGRPKLSPRMENLIKRYRHKGRHRTAPGQQMETRVRDAAGNDTGQRFYWTPAPTFRQKISHVRAQRAARRNLAAAWMHTGAFPVIEDTGWILRQRQAQKLAVYAEAMQP